MKPTKVKLNDRNIVYVAAPTEHPVTTTDAEIDAAIARSETAASVTVVKAEYDPATDTVRMWFSDGSDFGVLRLRLQGLERALPQQLKKIKIEGPGTGLYWPALDVAHYVPGLLEGIYGSRSWMELLERKADP